MPLCSLADLQRMIDRHKGKRGIRKAQGGHQAHPRGLRLTAGVPAAAGHCAGGLPEPELNVPIIDDDGTRHHEPDLSYRKYRIGIEYEGEHHGDEAADRP